MSESERSPVFDELLGFLQSTKTYSHRLPETVSRDFNLIESEILDSIGILQFVIFLENRFRITVESTELTEKNFGTLARVEGYLERKKAGS